MISTLTKCQHCGKRFRSERSTAQFCGTHCRQNAHYRQRHGRSPGKVPFVHSRYARRADDHYPTIDGRCVQALVETWPIGGVIVDCCAPQGSGIVDWLCDHGHDARCAGTVDFSGHADWIVTNPPYKRGLVDEIARQAVHHCQQGRVQGVALLMRPIWDLAACRTGLFDLSLYRGQTRLQFRPWWSEERKAQPIHNFVWHVWAQGEGDPVVKYWPPSSAAVVADLTSEPRCRGQPGAVSGRGRRGRYHPASEGPRRSTGAIRARWRGYCSSPSHWSHVLPVLARKASAFLAAASASPSCAEPVMPRTRATFRTGSRRRAACARSCARSGW